MEKVEFERTFKSMQASNFSKIKEDGDQIHSLLKETSNMLRVSKLTSSMDCWQQ